MNSPLNEVPHRALDRCVEWEGRALQLVDEEELSLSAMRHFLEALEQSGGNQPDAA